MCFSRVPGLIRDPVTAQAIHYGSPRPHPRENKAVSHSEQLMMRKIRRLTRVTFQMNLIQPSLSNQRKLLLKLPVRNLQVVRRKKVEEKIPRRDEARATARSSSLFGGNEKETVPRVSK